MDPISLGLGIAGLGLSIFGSMKGSEVAGQQAAESRAIAGDEQKINAQKKMQMNLEAQRSQLQIFRNSQRARAQALNAATQQGASQGSGLQGGLAQVTDQSLFNSQGINQNQEIGNNIFGINNDISSHKMQLATLGGEAASAAGLASLGGSIMKAGPVIGQFGQQAFGGTGGFNFLFGGNAPTGYGSFKA